MVSIDTHLGVPDTIPIVIDHAVVGDLCIPVRAGGIHAEQERGAIVVQSVQNHAHAVGVADTEIFPEFVDHTVRDFRVPADHTHVEIVVVVKKAGLGLFGGGFALALPLEEIRSGDSHIPDRFFEISIDRNLFRNADRRRDLVKPGGLEKLGQGRSVPG